MKRISIICSVDPFTHSIAVRNEESEHGQFVFYVDAQAELDRLRAEMDGLATLLDLLRTGRKGEKFDCVESRHGGMVNVKAEIAKARGRDEPG